MQIEGSLATDDSAVKPHRCLRQGQVLDPSFLQMAGLYFGLKDTYGASDWPDFSVGYCKRAVDWSHGLGLRTGRPRIQAHLHIHANMHGRKEKELHSLTKERLVLLRQSSCKRRQTLARARFLWRAVVLQRSADAGSMLTDQCATNSCLEKAYTVHPHYRWCGCVCAQALSKNFAVPTNPSKIGQPF